MSHVRQWLQISEAKRECTEEDEEYVLDKSLCEMLATKDTHVLIRQLDGNRYLLVEVRIDMKAAGRKHWFDAASIELVDDTIELDACDGRIRISLPASAPDSPPLDSPPAE